METKLLAGSAWGVPVRGALVDLSSADVSAILTSAAGVAKGLFFVGSALAFAAVALFASLKPKRDALSWGTLAEVETWDGFYPGIFGGRRFSRQFRGVCLTREITISSDDHKFDIPVEYIASYCPTVVRRRFSSRTYVDLNLSLFDGSSYRGSLLAPNEFEFLTSLGKQVVPANASHAIHGCSIVEAAALRSNIDGFLNKEAYTAEQALGADSFRRFFVKSAAHR